MSRSAASWPRSRERGCATTRSSFSPATTAAPRAALFATGARSDGRARRERRRGAGRRSRRPRTAAFRGGKGSALRGRRARAGHSSNWPAQAQARAWSTSRCTWSTSCRPLLALAGGQGQRRSSVRRHKICGRRWPKGQPSPHEDVLINVEAFRGAIRKGNWKLVKHGDCCRARPSCSILSTDPGEKNNVAGAASGDRAATWRQRLIAYARQKKPSEWIKAQPAFLGRAGQDGLRPRLRHRRRRPAARKGGPAAVVQAIIRHRSSHHE